MGAASAGIGMKPNRPQAKSLREVGQRLVQDIQEEFAPILTRQTRRGPTPRKPKSVRYQLGKAVGNELISSLAMNGMSWYATIVIQGSLQSMRRMMLR